MISDINLYCDRMFRSISEKLFFVNSQEFARCKTIVDFGCADGSMLSYMENMFPEKTLFGIDNNKEMIRLCTKKCNRSVFFATLDDFKAKTRVIGKSGIVLSSVLHEVYSFESPDSISRFWDIIRDTFDYVFIRDMYTPRVIPGAPMSSDFTLAIARFTTDPYYSKFIKKWGPIQNRANAMHFLLKRMYENNFESELKENYFSVPWAAINGWVSENEIVYKNLYTNEYLTKYFLENYKIDLKEPTHCQLILAFDKAARK